LRPGTLGTGPAENGNLALAIDGTIELVTRGDESAGLGLGTFHPPQGYIRLAKHRQLLTLWEKMAAVSPVRKMQVANLAAGQTSRNE
jgi:hypothetical protein